MYSHPGTGIRDTMRVVVFISTQYGTSYNCESGKEGKKAETVLK